jgi:hypothetical protein
MGKNGRRKCEKIYTTQSTRKQKGLAGKVKDYMKTRENKT